MANYLGKCKECDYVIFATSEDVQDADGWRDVTKGTGVYRVGNNGCFARCSNGHKFFACKLVKGTYSPDHKCDSRCLNAKGWSCTCSCGGANHGRGHVATIVTAADLRHAPKGKDLTPARIADKGLLDLVVEAVVRENPELAKPVLKHLGEVGKHITGEVTVDDLSTVNGSTLYTFKSVNGGHIIKWFAPSYADPQWPLGKTFTLRAKVKRHAEFQGVPETVVTYGEEVE